MYTKTTCSSSTQRKKYPVRCLRQIFTFFNDTISDLESEMYQLSHLLSEHRLLLSALADTALLADETTTVQEVENNDEQEDEQDVKKRKLASILEKVEGCNVRT